MRQQISIYLSFHAKLILFSMNPLGGTHICFWQIFFLVLPPRFWGDCHPSSHVTVAVMSFSSRRRPHRFHLPSGSQGGKGEWLWPLWRASPTTLPAGQGHSLSPLVKGTVLILTRRAGQVCTACHSIGFRAVSRFTAVVRESPLPLCLLFLDAHGNRRMFLPVAGICCRCHGVCFLFPRLTS